METFTHLEEGLNVVGLTVEVTGQVDQLLHPNTEYSKPVMSEQQRGGTLPMILELYSFSEPTMATTTTRPSLHYTI